MLTLPACIHIKIPRAIPHSSVQPTMAPSTLFQTTDSPRNLTGPLQSPVSENVPADSGKLVGRRLGHIDKERKLQDVPCNQECQAMLLVI